jgi:glutathione S-transferase
VAGDEFSVADITAVVTVDFATKAAGLPMADEHTALKRWYGCVSARASIGGVAHGVRRFSGTSSLRTG